MDMLKRFLLSLAAGTVAFSAVPAFALEANLGASADVKGSLMLNRCKQMEDDDRAECERRVRLQLDARHDAELRAERRENSHGAFVSESHAHAHAEQETEVTLHERMWKRAVDMTERLVARAGTFAKKMCRAQSDDASVIASCVSNLRSSFQASVNAAITAAFTL